MYIYDQASENGSKVTKCIFLLACTVDSISFMSPTSGFAI